VNEPSFSGDFSLAAGFLRHFFLKKVADPACKLIYTLLLFKSMSNFLLFFNPILIV
jgi:hypothetical protein